MVLLSSFVKNDTVLPWNLSQRRRPFGHRRAGRAVATVAVICAMALAACAGSGFEYVSSPSSGTYFKVPQAWEVFDERQVLGADPTKPPEDSGLQFLRILDASPHATAADLKVQTAVKPEFSFQLVDFSDQDGMPYNWPWFRLQTSTLPFGVAWVRNLTIEERDTFSRLDLRNEVIPLDALMDSAIYKVRQIRPPEGIVKPKGAAGTRLVYEVTLGETSFVVDQTGLVDPEHRLVYFFIAGCRSECYAQHGPTITQIADSWTIKEL